MAEQKIAAAFPAPPPFYKHFTKQNTTRLRQLRKEAGIAPPPPPSSPPPIPSTPRPDLDPISLPPELRHLIPPPPPADGRYTSFGVAIDRQAAEPTLSSSEIEQLYPASERVHLNPQPHLLALARSLLTTFLALAGTLGRDPTAYEPVAHDLQTLLYNMHDLINQYRPHQARETLVLLMEERVERMRAEARRVEEGRERVKRLLEGVRDQGRELGMKEEREGCGGREKDGVERGEKVGRERQRMAWKALEGMEG